MSKNAPAFVGWLMWGLVANLYFIGFFQRVAPAVMVNELMRDFSLGGALLGNLSATYFYAYAAMQIPSGLLSDAIGPRRLSAGAAILAGIGIIIFGLATSLHMAYLGRFIIGGSVAVAFVTCMKLAGHWFSSNRFATVTGMALLVGNLGGVLAGMPLAEAVSAFGWRTSMIASAIFTFTGAGAIWFFVRDDPHQLGYRSHAHTSVVESGSLKPWPALKSVMSNRDTWFLFFAGGFSAAPILVFAGLWGVPYLTQIYGLERSHSAFLTSAILVSWAIGGPTLGALSDRIGRRKPIYLISCILATSLWGIFLFVDLPLFLLYPLFVAIGFTSGGLIIGFAFAREANHPGAAGAVGGLVNMSVLGVAAIMQPVLGIILDHHWSGLIVNGTRIYNNHAYGSAFLWFFITSLLSIIAVMFVRETYCRQSGAKK